MSKFSNKQIWWKQFQSNLFLNIDCNDIVGHSRKTFDYDFFAFTAGAKFGFESNAKDLDLLDESSRCSKYIFANCVANGNLGKLKALIDAKDSNDIILLSLIEVYCLLYPCFVLNNSCSDLEFWHVIDSAQIDSEPFLSFHFFNYTYHGIKFHNKNGGRFGSDSIFNMKLLSNFYSSELVMESRDYCKRFEEVLCSFLKNPMLDEAFVKFKTEYDDTCLLETGSCISDFFSRSLEISLSDRMPLISLRLEEF